jgi:methionyl-tRNA formyltransferase
VETVEAPGGAGTFGRGLTPSGLETSAERGAAVRTVRRRLAFLGTPEVAAEVLGALVEAGHEVSVAVTRPDRRRGRGGATSASPVKQQALRLGIRVTHRVDDLVDTGVELGVVVAYGRMVPEHVLARVPMVNLHFSLLPRWRGAAPVERAILAGDTSTGVSLMSLDRGLDTGPLFAQKEVAIEPGEHVGPLRARLAEVGTCLLLDLLEGPLPEPVAQRGEPTYADKLATQELELQWARPAAELARLVRLDRAWTTWRGRRLRVLEAAAEEARDRAAAVAAPAPGTLMDDVVATGKGVLRLVRVQPEGRAPMATATWLRGARPIAGERFGSP